MVARVFMLMVVSVVGLSSPGMATTPPISGPTVLRPTQAEELLDSRSPVTTPTPETVSLDEVSVQVRRWLFQQHLQLVANVPAEYASYVFQAAMEYQLDPLELAAVLIAERGGSRFDYSVEAAFADPPTHKYNPLSEGSASERGLFQIMPRWARLAGYEAEDLWNPETNARVAAYVVSENKNSHAGKCAGTVHTWYAHYNCTSKSRNDSKGPCQRNQLRFAKIYESLSAASPDFQRVTADHKQRLR